MDAYLKNQGAIVKKTENKLGALEKNLNVKEKEVKQELKEFNEEMNRKMFKKTHPVRKNNFKKM